MTEPSSPLLRIRKALGRVRRRFNHDVFHVFTKPVPEEASFESPPGYAFRWGTPDDIAACSTYHTELDEAERRAGIGRLALGHRVVVGIADDGAGDVVFSMWANPRNLNVPGLLKRRLAPDQWFIYKAFTSPDHRGKKLYQAGMRFVLHEMRAEGMRELVGYAHVKKSVSRKGLARLDFGSAGRVSQLDVPGWRRTFVSSELASHFPEELARSGWTPTDSPPATSPSTESREPTS